MNTDLMEQQTDTFCFLAERTIGCSEWLDLVAAGRAAAAATADTNAFNEERQNILCWIRPPPDGQWNLPDKKRMLRKSDSAAETNGLVKEKKNRRKANKAKKELFFFSSFFQ